jgi:hypothetical protein
MRYKISLGLNRVFQGENGGKGRGGVNLHAPEHQYIVNRCHMSILKPGESQWVLQGSKNATTARGLTRHEEETHQSIQCDILAP